MIFIQVLIKAGALRFTTWIRDYTHGGEQYIAAGVLQRLQLPNHAIDPTQQTLSFQLSLAAQVFQVEGLGPVASTVTVFYSTDYGLSWLGPTYEFEGLLSRSAVDAGLWSAEVEKNETNRLIRRAELTHERQQELYVDDNGLEYMASLEQGIYVELF